MSHRRVRDRVEKELFGRLAPKEENEDVAETERTRKIVEAAKGLLMEEPGLTAAELHERLSRDGASLPKVTSFAVHATRARKELGIDGRKATAGHVEDPQGEDPAGDDSEAGANSPTPAPPAEEGLEEPDQDSHTVVATPAARSTSTYERPGRRTEGGNVEYMRIRNGEVLVKASGPLAWVKAMVAALPEEAS